MKMTVLEWLGNSPNLNPIKKPVVYHEKSLDKTGLHYKNEADLVRHARYGFTTMK